MSVLASITITSSPASTDMDALPALLEMGWSVDYYGSICYLPLHDDGSYDWQYAPLDDWPRIQTIITAQKQQDEVIGIGLTWQDSEIGATLNFSPDGKIVIVLTDHRVRLIDGLVFTDFSWYLTRVMKALTICKYAIQEIECSETLDD